jgi:hypothetical protein
MAQDIETLGIANATTEPEEHGEIEITEEMVEAAAEVLWSRDLLEIGEGLALSLAEEMLKCALAARHEEIGAVRRQEH